MLNNIITLITKGKINNINLPRLNNFINLYIDNIIHYLNVKYDILSLEPKLPISNFHEYLYQLITKVNIEELLQLYKKDQSELIFRILTHTANEYQSEYISNPYIKENIFISKTNPSKTTLEIFLIETSTNINNLYEANIPEAYLYPSYPPFINLIYIPIKEFSLTIKNTYWYFNIQPDIAIYKINIPLMIYGYVGYAYHIQQLIKNNQIEPFPYHYRYISCNGIIPILFDFTKLYIQNIILKSINIIKEQDHLPIKTILNNIISEYPYLDTLKQKLQYLLLDLNEILPKLKNNNITPESLLNSIKLPDITQDDFTISMLSNIKNIFNTDMPYYNIQTLWMYFILIYPYIKDILQIYNLAPEYSLTKNIYTYLKKQLPYLKKLNFWNYTNNKKLQNIIKNMFDELYQKVIKK